MHQGDRRDEELKALVNKKLLRYWKRSVQSHPIQECSLNAMVIKTRTGAKGQIVGNKL